MVAEGIGDFQRIAIIGTGMIGGSLGLAINKNIEVSGYDRDEGCLRQALSIGAISRAADDLRDAVSDADLIVLATPVASIAASFADAAPYLRAGVIVTDVGSTKNQIVKAIDAITPKGVQFIGGHPLAGSERQGIDAASATLFAGAFWILTPTENADAGSYGKLVRFLTDLKAQVLSLDPARHDEALALSSHLPQLLSSTLMAFAAQTSSAGLPLLAAGGFRDMTRIAGSSPVLWIDIVKQNRHAVLEMMKRFESVFHERLVEISRSDWDALERALSEAKQARDHMASKQGLRDSELVELVIQVPDRPGALAEVTTTLGEARINIEDLDIVHSPEPGRGAIHLLLGNIDAAAKAREALENRNFVVS